MYIGVACEWVSEGADKGRTTPYVNHQDKRDVRPVMQQVVTIHSPLNKTNVGLGRKS